jgi:hypothetical protein
MDRKHLIRTVAVILATMQASCITSSSSSETAPQAMTDLITATATQTQEIPTLAQTPVSPSPTEPPSASGVPLSAQGPWFLFLANPNQSDAPFLWAINADGTGLTQLVNEHVFSFDVYHSETDSGTDTRIAYISATDDLEDLTLHVFNFPDGTNNVITPLTSETTRLPDGANAWEITVAITLLGSLRWSPDGQWLAFVGAMDGDSADVYSYEVAGGTIRQLTSDPTQAWQLLWTPDSRMIVHTGNDRFGVSGSSMAGDVAGMWGATPDGREAVKLGDRAGSQFLGWLTSDTLLLHSGPRLPCLSELRTLNVNTAESTSLVEGCFQDIATDFRSGISLISFDESYANYPELGGGLPDAGYGTYLLEGGVFRQVSDVTTTPYWSPESNVFFAPSVSDNRMLVISLDGTVTEVTDMEGSQVVKILASPEGNWLAWTSTYSKELWVGQLGASPRRISTDYVSGIYWSPDGRHLLFVGETLFVSASPDFQPAAIAPELDFHSWISDLPSTGVWVP